MSDLERIEAAMEEKVRPALRSHGGDISIDHVAVSYTHLDVYKRQVTASQVASRLRGDVLTVTLTAECREELGTQAPIRCV